jgi:hypothetical protein
MSHRWDCPTDYDARQQARRDAEHDLPYGSRRRAPYDCDEGNDVYRDEYRRAFDRLEEERLAERSAAHRREMAREQEELEMQQYYEAEEQRRAEEAYWQQQAEQEDPTAQPENQPDNIR